MSVADVTIILDNQNISNTLKIMLEEAGFNAKVHVTSDEALSDFKSGLPAIIVHCSDGSQTDAPEFARELRRHHETPIIFLSVDTAAIEDMLRGDDLPGTFYLPMQEFSERSFIEQVRGCV